MYWHLYEGSSAQFSHAVMSNSLWPHGHQASLSITNSQSLLKLMSTSRWCHPAISSSVILFSFQSFPASGSFPVSQFFTSVRVASDPPRSQEMTRDTEYRGIMLSSLWILVLLWILSIHLACFYFCIPLGSKDLITLNFKNLLFTVQGWRSWWEAAFLCAHSEPFEFRKQGSEAPEKTQTFELLET